MDTLTDEQKIKYINDHYYDSIKHLTEFKVSWDNSKTYQSRDFFKIMINNCGPFDGNKKDEFDTKFVKGEFIFLYIRNTARDGPQFQETYSEKYVWITNYGNILCINRADGGFLNIDFIDWNNFWLPLDYINILKSVYEENSSTKKPISDNIRNTLKVMKNNLHKINNI